MTKLKKGLKVWLYLPHRKTSVEVKVLRIQDKQMIRVVLPPYDNPTYYTTSPHLLFSDEAEINKALHTGIPVWTVDFVKYEILEAFLDIREDVVRDMKGELVEYRFRRSTSCTFFSRSEALQALKEAVKILQNTIQQQLEERHKQERNKAKRQTHELYLVLDQIEKSLSGESKQLSFPCSDDTNKLQQE